MNRSDHESEVDKESYFFFTLGRLFDALTVIGWFIWLWANRGCARTLLNVDVYVMGSIYTRTARTRDIHGDGVDVCVDTLCHRVTCLNRLSDLVCLALGSHSEDSFVERQAGRCLQYSGTAVCRVSSNSSDILRSSVGNPRVELRM